MKPSRTKSGNETIGADEMATSSGETSDWSLVSSKPPAITMTPRRRQKISGYIRHLVNTALPIPEESDDKPTDHHD